MLTDLAESSGYSSKTLQSGSCKTLSSFHIPSSRGAYEHTILSVFEEHRHDSTRTDTLQRCYVDNNAIVLSDLAESSGCSSETLER